MPALDHPSSWGEAINGGTQLFDLLNSARLLYCLLALLQAKAELEVKVRRTKQGFCFKALSIWLEQLVLGVSKAQEQNYFPGDLEKTSKQNGERPRPVGHSSVTGP